MNESTQLALGIDKFHRNEYLFSDHYLDSILRRDPAWNAAQGPAADFLNWLREHYAAEGDQLAAYNEAQLEENWIRPILGRLGHVWESQASIPGLDKTIKKPDYVFFPDDDTRKAVVAEQRTEGYTRRALAMGEVKAWPVSLSHKTAGAPTFANNNPMFQIDYYLKATGAAWGIAANGRFWRLVHKDSSYRLDRYFEIDLLAALNAPDERRALAVATWFTLFFGRAAFMPDETGRVFLDDVLKGSRTYAVALESDLRDNAYKALEQLILGFFAPAANGLSPDDEADRAAVYRNSLLLLYRLLFLFFGESRGLLPMDNDGYRERSLTELAKRAAKLVDDHKVDALPPMTGTYWARYKELFAIIDGRDAALNAFLGVPRYNGGLFDPQRHAFLENNFVGERHLVRAIDYLARRRKTENGKFAGYESVDYRTLGVRQLGSIYEGLLEYKVSVAAEEMVTVRKGGKETWLPARERGKTKVIETKQPGELYLSTDKGERKATGSYYTPDYIVKYIVEQTLAPLVEAAREKITNYELRITNEERAARFVKEILSLNVLDPAMGSGHFLVDATNYLARALATSEWSEGEKGRGGEGEKGREGEGEIAPAPLPPGSLSPAPPFSESDLTYWKRRVVETCIYGVDKNELAVELAKLSLWLETVAADKPLSFLDHHLRHGDSLIGARLADLERAPSASRPDRSRRPVRSPESQTDPLFDESAFTTSAGLAVGGMAAIEARPTDDLDTVHAKEDAFHIIHDTHLGRWRRLADLWVSAWFGNAMSAEEYRDLALRIQGKPGGLMSDEQAARYLNHPAAAANDYFHWELEFPEVFFDRHGRPKGEKAGFDAVICNPPYDVLASKELGYDVTDQINFFTSNPSFSASIRGKNNLYKLFVNHIVGELLKETNLAGFIVPMAILGDRQAEALRRWLLERHQFLYIDAFPQKDDANDRVFFEAKLSTCVFILRSTIAKPERIIVRTHPGKDFLPDSKHYQFYAYEILQYDPLNSSIPTIDKSSWELAIAIVRKPFMSYMGKYVTCFQGEVNISTHKPSITKNPTDSPFLKGSQISKYRVQPPSQGEVEWINEAKYRKLVGNTPKSKHHEVDRLVMQGISGVDDSSRLVATLCNAGTYLGHSTNYILPNPELSIKLPYFLALLNSQLFEWRFRQTSSNNNVNSYEIEALPTCLITFTASEQERNEFNRHLQRRYLEGHYHDIVSILDELTTGLMEHIHDLLSYLAQQMITLHQEKQTLTADFWTDLEGITTPAAFRKLRDKGKQEAGLAADPALAPFVRAESKSTRTLDESLAWDEAAFKGFVRALAGPVDGLSRLLKVYHTHAPRYRDLTDRIARTDTLIDQIVYKLYGLTDEEIAIVEGG